MECPVGYSASTDMINRCNICPIGTYSDNINAESCENCKTGQTTPREGSTSSLCHIDLGNNQIFLYQIYI